MNEKPRFRTQSKYIQQVVLDQILFQVSLNNYLLSPPISLKQADLRFEDTQTLGAWRNVIKWKKLGTGKNVFSNFCLLGRCLSVLGQWFYHEWKDQQKIGMYFYQAN